MVEIDGTPPAEEKRPSSSYWLIALVLAAPVLITLVLLITFSGGWLHNLWFNYAWSSDKGNGPEAIQQTILYGTIAAVLIPAVRHFVKREFDKVHAKIETEHAKIHAKLDHIITESPDIGPFVPK